MKIPPLTKGDYDLWAMKFETHLQHTDPGAWDVIKKGNDVINYIKLADGTFEEAPAKSVAEQQRRDKEKRARTSLLMAITWHTSIKLMMQRRCGLPLKLGLVATLNLER